MEDVEKWDLRSQKASKKGKCDWGKRERCSIFVALFNEGSGEILKLSERKRGGVGFVEIENARKMRNKNEALQQNRRDYPWKLSANFLKNIGNSTQGFQ